MHVYKITNTITNKVYIGKDSKPPSSETRWKSHKRLYHKEGKHYKNILYKSIRKHGLLNFKYESIASAISPGTLSKLEYDLIKQYNSLFPNGYNMTMGGDGGSTPRDKMTPDQIKNRSTSAIRKFQNKEFRRLHSERARFAANNRILNETDQQRKSRLQILKEGRGRACWKVVSPTGEIYETNNITELSNKLAIPRSRIVNAYNGRERRPSGWVVNKLSVDKSRFGGPSAISSWELRYPDGRICHIVNLKEYCKQNGLPYQEIYNTHRYTKRNKSQWQAKKMS